MKTTTWKNSRIISENIGEEIEKLKKQPGKNLLMIGSPRTAHTFMQLGLIDEYWINLNPVILGNGIPLFKDIKNRISLKLLNEKKYDSGVVAFHYQTDKK